jgi:hypothetical protein
MIHILVGQEAAKNLEEAFALDENLIGEIVVLKDTLGIGPIHPNEDEKFIGIRTDFWKELDASFPEEEQVLDENTIKLLAVRAQREEEPLCFWMSPCVTDVCAYFWLLTHLKQFPAMLHTINIIGLPFLNEKGQLFYPTNLSQIQPSEFLKAKKLARPITLSEFELDPDEWKKLCIDNGFVRFLEGGKKLASMDISYYDKEILSLLTKNAQKLPSALAHIISKMKIKTGDVFIVSRLKALSELGKLTFTGNWEKGWKDIVIQMPGGSSVVVED